MPSSSRITRSVCSPIRGAGERTPFVVSAKRQRDSRVRAPTHLGVLETREEATLVQVRILDNRGSTSTGSPPPPPAALRHLPAVASPGPRGDLGFEGILVGFPILGGCEARIACELGSPDDAAERLPLAIRRAGDRHPLIVTRSAKAIVRRPQWIAVADPLRLPPVRRKSIHPSATSADVASQSATSTCWPLPVRRRATTRRALPKPR